MDQIKMNPIFQDAFQKLKPFCVKLIKTGSIENIQNLKTVCDDLDKVSLQMLQEYLIFPIRLRLKEQTNENVITEYIGFLTFIFRRTKVLNWNLFQDVMSQIFCYINTFPENGAICAKSEELKAKICDCGEAIISNCSTEILKKVYSKDFCLPLAQYVFGILQLIKVEIAKPLRKSAVKVLASFLCCKETLKEKAEIIPEAGDRLATFLPGVSTALHDVICGDIKQGHEITVLSLDILGKFIAITVGDKFINETTEIVKQDKILNESVIRNSAWIATISNKLEIIIKKIAQVATHEHWKVRLALVRCAEMILCNCSKNLPNCISPLLQLLFALSVDQYQQVTKATESVIQRFAKLVDNTKSFHAILEEDVFNMSGKLIRIHLSTNDCEKLLLLKTLHGYFLMLGKSVVTLLYSLPHLDKFILSVLNLVKFDYFELNFMAEELPSSDFSNDLQKLWLHHKFLYFHEAQIASRICSIFELLSSNGDSNVLVDYLLEKHSAQYQNESVFLLISVLKGLNEKPSKENTNKLDRRRNADQISHTVSLVFESLLSSEVWKVSFNSHCDNLTPDVSKANMLQVALILECIATCSSILKVDFNPFLSDVLCPVMEKAGCNNFMILHSGKLTLGVIAHHCGYKSIADLIINNVDYLINSTMIQLHYFSCQPETVVIFQVITKYCNSDILPFLKAPIYEMLHKLDLNQKKALPVMKVLRFIVEAIGTWFPGASRSQIVKSSSSLKSKYLERHSLKIIEMSFQDMKITEGDSKEIENNEDTLDDEQKEIELHVEIINEVLKRCVHLMSSNHLELTILTLELIGASIIALRNNTDKIHPYIHEIWSPLMHRFKEDITVSMKAFETLIVIVKYCGEFVKARTLKDVWPKFLTFLKSQMAFSANKRNFTNYSITSAFKYQLLILSEIGSIAKNLDLTEKEIEMLSLNCLLYLNHSQPEILQKAAKQSLDSLVLLDPDALWFHYNELYCIQMQLELPCSDFKPVYFQSHLSKLISNHHLCDWEI